MAKNKDPGEIHKPEVANFEKEDQDQVNGGGSESAAETSYQAGEIMFYYHALRLHKTFLLLLCDICAENLLALSYFYRTWVPSGQSHFQVEKTRSHLSAMANAWKYRFSRRIHSLRKRRCISGPFLSR